MNKCPYCDFKLLNNKTIECSNCFENINTANNLPYQQRLLKLAVRVNNINNIYHRSKQILDQDPVNIYAKYCFAYANYIKGEKELLQDFLSISYEKTTDLLEILNHCIYYCEHTDKNLVALFVKNNTLDINKYEHPFSLDLTQTIDINEIQKKKLYIKQAIGSAFTGLLLLVVAIMITSVLRQEIVYFTSVLLLILPSIFLGMASTRAILKTGNIYLSFLLMLLVLIVSSYIILYQHQQGLSNHVIKVITAPFDMVSHMLESFIGG